MPLDFLEDTDGCQDTYPNADVLQAAYIEEIPKDDHVYRQIKHINTLITRRCASLGIDKTFDIPPESIHLLPSNVYDRYFPNYTDSLGLMRPESSSIHIRVCSLKSILDYLFLFHTLLHECIHVASKHRYKIENNNLSVVQSGYSRKSTNGNRYYFENVNEAVTEEMTNDMIDEHHDDIEIAIGPIFSRAVANRRNNTYRLERDILNKVLRNMQFEHSTDAWRAIQIGYLSGVEDQFQPITSTMSRSTLRLYAALPTYSSLEKEAYNKKIDLKRKGVLLNKFLAYMDMDPTSKEGCNIRGQMYTLLRNIGMEDDVVAVENTIIDDYDIVTSEAIESVTINGAMGISICPESVYS